MRLYRSRCGLAGAQEGYSRRCSDRLDEASQANPRHGCIPAEPAAVSPGKIIVPRIVIGGVILDQPAGCGIGAAKRGASSLRSRGAAISEGCRPASISCGATDGAVQRDLAVSHILARRHGRLIPASWDPRLIGPALAPDHAYFISPVQLSYCDCGTPSAKPGVGVSSTACRSCGHDLSLC